MAQPGHVSTSLKQETYVAARDLANLLSEGRVKSVTISEAIRLAVDAYGVAVSGDDAKNAPEWFGAAGAVTT